MSSVDVVKHALPMKLKDGKRHVWPTLASQVYLDDGTTPLADEQGLLRADDANKLGGVAADQYALKTDIPEGTGGVTMELLWTNSSPTSAFSNQTLYMDLSDAEYIAIEQSPARKGSSYFRPELRFYSKESAMLVPTMYASTDGDNSPLLTYRPMTISGTGIVFGDGYFQYTNETSNYTSTAYAVPLNIYKIKGVSE